MTKYIVYILSGIFLMLGLNHALTQEVRKFRAEAGTITVESFSGSGHCLPPVLAGQSDKYKQTAKDEGNRYKPDEGILSNVSPHRSLNFSRTLKFNSTGTSLQILRFLNSRFSDRNRNAFSPDIRSVKYSSGYYVYTLERMLI